MHPQHLSLGREKRVPIRGLVFDMDGTIVDTRRFHMDAWRYLVGKLGLPAQLAEIAERGFGKTNWLIFQEWFGPRGDSSTYDKLSDDKEEIFRKLIHGQARARAGFHELLAWARPRGIRIALATSGPRENAEFLLGELGVRGQFDAVVYGHAAIKSKPHPDPFLQAAQRLNLPPRQCLGFEDSSHGFWSVARAGMGLVAIAERHPDMLFNRKWTAWSFADFRPVPRLIQRLNRAA